MNSQKRAVRVPIHLERQPEGGFTVTSRLLPELITEGDTFDEAIANAADALIAVSELYEDTGRALPPEIFLDTSRDTVALEMVGQV